MLSIDTNLFVTVCSIKACAAQSDTMGLRVNPWILSLCSLNIFCGYYYLFFICLCITQNVLKGNACTKSRIKFAMRKQ